MILTVLNNGLGLLDASSPQILLVNGLILMLVVLLDGRLGAAAGRLTSGRVGPREKHDPA